MLFVDVLSHRCVPPSISRQRYTQKAVEISTHTLKSTSNTEKKDKHEFSNLLSKTAWWQNGQILLSAPGSVVFPQHSWSWGDFRCLQGNWTSTHAFTSEFRNRVNTTQRAPRTFFQHQSMTKYGSFLRRWTRIDNSDRQWNNSWVQVWGWK